MKTFEVRESGEKETKIETAIKNTQRKIAILAVFSMTVSREINISLGSVKWKNKTYYGIRIMEK